MNIFLPQGTHGIISCSYEPLMKLLYQYLDLPNHDSCIALYIWFVDWRTMVYIFVFEGYHL